MGAILPLSHVANAVILTAEANGAGFDNAGLQSTK